MYIARIRVPADIWALAINYRVLPSSHSPSSDSLPLSLLSIKYLYEHVLLGILGALISLSYDPQSLLGIYQIG